MKKHLLTAALILSAACIARGGQLEGVWVTSSASVDTSSTAAIVAGLVKPGMSDEQKALAIFNWYRRVIYPHNYMGDDRRDVLRQINSYGSTLCGSHAANLGWLMREAGFKTRCVFIRGGGHTFIEVFYDGGWHALDPETDLAVWSRAMPNERPHLISMDELKADPTLLDNAIEEGRARPWLFKAMQHPFATRKAMADYCDTNRLDKMAMQWSSCVLKGETIKDYFIEGVKTVRYSAENEPYGGRVSDPDLMKLTLRANEMLIRRWSNEGRGKYILGQGFQGYPSHFMAGGGADELDEDVFPWVEPYRIDNYGIPAIPVDRCYRYSGNGRLTWAPAGMHEVATAPGVRLDGAVVDRDAGLLRRADPEKPATITIPFRSSYALVDARVNAVWSHGPGRLFVLSGRQAAEVAPPTQPDGDSPGRGTGRLAEGRGNGERSGYSFYKEINGRLAYELRIELPERGGLRQIAFNHTFVNNWLVLPALAPGKNTIRVRLDNPDMLRQTRLTIVYRWAEGEGWKTDKEDRREVTGSPFEYELTAAGPKFPRMKELLLEAAPR